MDLSEVQLVIEKCLDFVTIYFVVNDNMCDLCHVFTVLPTNNPLKRRRILAIIYRNFNATV